MKLGGPYICYIVDLIVVLLSVLVDKINRIPDIRIQESNLKSYCVERRIVPYCVCLERVWRDRVSKPARLAKVRHNYLKSALSSVYVAGEN